MVVSVRVHYWHRRHVVAVFTNGSTIRLWHGSVSRRSPCAGTSAATVWASATSIWARPAGTATFREPATVFEHHQNLGERHHYFARAPPLFSELPPAFSGLHRRCFLFSEHLQNLGERHHCCSSWPGRAPPLEHHHCWACSSCACFCHRCSVEHHRCSVERHHYSVEHRHCSVERRHCSVERRHVRSSAATIRSSAATFGLGPPRGMSTFLVLQRTCFTYVARQPYTRGSGSSAGYKCTQIQKRTMRKDSCNNNPKKFFYCYYSIISSTGCTTYDLTLQKLQSTKNLFHV